MRKYAYMHTYVYYSKGFGIRLIRVRTSGIERLIMSVGGGDYFNVLQVEHTTYSQQGCVQNKSKIHIRG
jgi:hypothetical protein